MRKLRVIHYGIAHDHSVFAMQMLRRYPDVFEIVGVCEPDETARRVFGGKDEYAGLPWLSEDEVLSREDIDAAFCEGAVFLTRRNVWTGDFMCISTSRAASILPRSGGFWTQQQKKS